MMPPITPAASDVESPAEEAKETPQQEASEHEIKCAARDCKYNKGGVCTTDISVSAGPAVKCETYEPAAKGPMPPMPMKPGGGLGAMM